MFSLFVVFYIIIAIITFFAEQRIYSKTMLNCNPDHEWLWEGLTYSLAFMRKITYVILGSGMFIKILIYLKESKLLL